MNYRSHKIEGVNCTKTSVFIPSFSMKKRCPLLLYYHFVSTINPSDSVATISGCKRNFLTREFHSIGVENISCKSRNKMRLYQNKCVSLQTENQLIL